MSRRDLLRRLPDFLASERTTRRARLWVPVLFGLWSLVLGQDRNWDLFNYHLYDAFALLHGKLRIDLAPAGMQSYFNPVLDVGYYVANQVLPAPLVGFALGVLHGLIFLPLLSLATSALQPLSDEDRARVPLLLAVAGVLTANFLSELGNSMGDNVTALFTLCSVALLVKRWSALSCRNFNDVLVVLAAGALGGIAVGFKLTNAVYVAAICGALLFYRGTLVARVRVSFLYGVGSVVGFAVVGGYWLWVMWKTFGNPFFPQFSSLFPNPLVPPLGIADQSWLPHGVREYLLWPFLFSLNSKRVGQATLHQIIWPVLYVTFFAWVIVSVWRGRSGRARVALSGQARFVIATVAIGYLLWMRVFSIYRYIVPIEVLAPLALYLLLTTLMPSARGRRVAAYVLSASTLLVLAGGVHTWGHEKWAARAFQADLPQLDDPAKSTAILVGGDPPWGWLTTLFPSSMAFAQVEGNFPYSPAFDERLHQIVVQRGGPVFTILDGRYNWRIDNVASMNRVVDGLGLTSSASGCHTIGWAVNRLRLHASVMTLTPSADGRFCRLGLRADDIKDTDAENRQIVAAAAPLLAKHGFEVDPASCALYFAHIGNGTFPYQWCRVRAK